MSEVQGQGVPNNLPFTVSELLTPYAQDVSEDDRKRIHDSVLLDIEWISTIESERDNSVGREIRLDTCLVKTRVSGSGSGIEWSIGVRPVPYTLHLSGAIAPPLLHGQFKKDTQTEIEYRLRELLHGVPRLVKDHELYSQVDQVVTSLVSLLENYSTGIYIPKQYTIYLQRSVVEISVVGRAEDANLRWMVDIRIADRSTKGTNSGI